jgi:hypothetical protein
MQRSIITIALLFAVAVVLSGCPAVQNAVANIPPLKVGDKVTVCYSASNDFTKSWLLKQGDVTAINGVWVCLQTKLQDGTYGEATWCNLNTAASMSLAAAE